MNLKIGLEIHEQISTSTKLYCKCRTNYRDAEPNTNICEVCTGMPGAKPTPINQAALDAVVKIALLLNCEIVKEQIYVQRKHYDYPDLPNGYQRTSLPIGINGNLNGIGIWEVHLEEDPGKYDPVTGKVDYNRCGIPLVEIVTAPDMTSPEQAKEFLRELVKILDYSSVARLEGGTMRADTNISLEGGSRVEIKNINSVRGAYKAILFEIARQKNLMQKGKAVKRETRAFLESQMITVAMRTKEEADDYRYIPDPDVMPVLITRQKIEEIRAALPETPQMKEARLMKEYALSHEEAKVIAGEIELSDAFEIIATQVDPKFASNWIKRELMRVLEYNNLTFAQSRIKPEHLIELLKMMQQNEITVKTAQKVMEVLATTPKAPKEIVKELELHGIEEEDAVEKAVQEVIKENKQAVDDYLAGREKALNYLVGQVMKKTRGKAQPDAVLAILARKIDGSK